MNALVTEKLPAQKNYKKPVLTQNHGVMIAHDLGMRLAILASFSQNIF